MNLLIIEAITFLFAYACGRHDVPAVDSFTIHGSTGKLQAIFHNFNFILKLCYTVAVALSVAYPIANGNWWRFGAVFLLIGLIIWAVFDPIVAIYRNVFTPPKKKWWYLSAGDGTNGHFIDRTLLGWFGEKAGIYKLLICVLVVVFLNVAINRWL